MNNILQKQEYKKCPEWLMKEMYFRFITCLIIWNSGHFILIVHPNFFYIK